MTRISITREVEVPDPVRLARYARAPELGPRVLFFSGGSALRDTSAHLPALTHNSVHLITPFDSGGSSARLRAAFPMLAVGDLRNRLMALADTELKGHPAVFRLFATRLDPSTPAPTLRATLSAIADGPHPLIDDVPRPLRRLIQTQLQTFRAQMPDDFDLRGASIGNLILAGGLLANEHDIDAVIFMFSKLVEVRGFVRPIVNANLHLAGRTRDGRTLVGQHRLTDPATLAGHPLEEVWLSADLNAPDPVTVAIDKRSRKLIDRAELIVYPIGSFFTSLMACLLPTGTGAAIAASACPKVFVPNCGEDPEQATLPVERCVERLLARLRHDAGANIPAHHLLNTIIVDRGHGHYPAGMDVEAIRALGVGVLDVGVCDPTTRRIDPVKLRDVLISIV